MVRLFLVHHLNFMMGRKKKGGSIKYLSSTLGRVPEAQYTWSYSSVWAVCMEVATEVQLAVVPSTSTVPRPQKSQTPELGIRQTTRAPEGDCLVLTNPHGSTQLKHFPPTCPSAWHTFPFPSPLSASRKPFPSFLSHTNFPSSHAVGNLFLPGFLSTCRGNLMDS